MPSHASLAKRPRLSYTPSSPLTIAAENFAAEKELARQRLLSQSRLKSSWEGIFAKYSQSFEGIADEIDQVTGEIVVDNGHVRGLAVHYGGTKNEAGSTKKGKRPVLWDGMRLARKKDDDNAPIAVGCEACRFQDELDDSVCLSCLPQRSTPPTVVTTKTATHLARGSGSTPASPATSVSRSPVSKSPRTAGRTETLAGRIETLAGRIETLAGRIETPASQSGNLPSDDFILEKLGSHGAAVVGFLARARAQSVMSSPIPIFTRGDDTPSKSQTSYVRGGRIEVEISSPRAKSSFCATGPAAMKTPLRGSEPCADDIRTWTPARVAAWMFANGILHDVDDVDLAHAIEKHQVSGAVIAGSASGRAFTLDDLRDKLEISSFSRRMQLWFGILKLKALAPSPLRRSQRHATSPLFSSVSAASVDPPAVMPIALPAKEADTWAPPPMQEDPFYSHVWCDEHPDGTPTKFPPRVADPIFFKTETPDSGAGSSAVKKGVKRKRGPAAGLVKVEAVEESPSANASPRAKTGGVKTPGMGTPAAKKSAGRSLQESVSESPKVATKAGGAKTPRPRTPAVRTPRSRTPAARTPRSRTPAARTPRSRTPAARTPRTPRTPRTEMSTPQFLIPETPAATTPTAKTPAAKTASAKTPAKKTPMKTPAIANCSPARGVPGWTTSSRAQAEKSSLRRSILVLGGDSDSDSDSDEPPNSSPVRARRTAVKEESDSEARAVGESKRRQHKCAGRFCFLCLSLDGEEDDLI